MCVKVGVSVGVSVGVCVHGVTWAGEGLSGSVFKSVLVIASATVLYVISCSGSASKKGTP